MLIERIAMLSLDKRSAFFILAIFYILFVFWVIMDRAYETINVVNDTNKRIETIIGNGK